jgi:hypothetical protein
LVEPATGPNFAQGILTVLDDSRLAQKLRTNVKRFVLGRFDWPSIAAKLEAIYYHLVAASLDSTGRIYPKRPAISMQTSSLSKGKQALSDTVSLVRRKS